jgi:thiamine-monophosphate kinase
MALSEFGLIGHFFGQHTRKKPTTLLGIGDDCALLQIPAGYELAITTDTMVENVHFLANTAPEHLGHKLLAVNLSDLASMGAKPLSVTLALTLPSVNESWLAAFSQGFFKLANQLEVDLVGGDTTKGPLAFTVQALGLVPHGQALRRNAAQVGDWVYVTGPLGSAGLGLKIAQGNCPYDSDALARFHCPMPQVAIGQALRGIANACIDISDGLLADLGHILRQSQVGACLQWEAMPFIPAVQTYIHETKDWLMPLTAGDDYELCFTINPANASQVPAGCHKIGVIEAASGLRINKAGNIFPLEMKGFEHFSP